MRVPMTLLPLSALLLASPAYADWQYTRWGMTPEQVTAASSGKVTVGPGDPQEEYPSAKIGASGDYSNGEFSFKAKFYFANGKLVDVRLKLVSADLVGDGYKIKNALDGRYGKPFSESGGLMPIITYQDAENNNRIDLVMIGNRSTMLEYRPLRDASSSGL